MKGGQASSVGFVLYDTDLKSEQNAVFGKIENGENIIELGNKDALIEKMREEDAPYSNGSVTTKITLILFAVYIVLFVFVCFQHTNLAQLLSGVVFIIGSFIPVLGLTLVVVNRYKDDEHMAQMRRYHGCEHKAINTGNKENSIENLRKTSIYEAECGTAYFGYVLFYVACLSIGILSLGFLGVLKLVLIMVVLAFIMILNVFNPLNPFKILQRPMVAKPFDEELLLALAMIEVLYVKNR